MKKCILSCFLAGIILTLTSFQVMAQGGRISFGNLKIIPGLNIQEQYDDNIFLGNGTDDSEELKESDFIMHLLPSLAFAYNLPERGRIQLGYRGDFAFYGERDENDWQTHTGSVGIDYNAPGGLIFGLQNTYTDAEDPFGTDEEFGLGDPQTKRWTNDLSSNIGYRITDRGKLFFFYNFYKQDFEQDADFGQDYDENEFGLGTELRLFPKTWGFLRYHYGKQDYLTHPADEAVTEENDADNKWHRVNAGLTWDPGSKLVGELNVGYKSLEHEHEFDSAGDRFADEDLFIAATSITWTATATTTLGLNISRELKVTASSSGENFEDTSVGLNLTQALLTKWTLTASFRYAKHDYNLPADNPRDDDNYDGSLGIDYAVQDWLGLGLSYTYKKKNSNEVTNEYENNQVVFAIRTTY